MNNPDRSWWTRAVNKAKAMKSVKLDGHWVTLHQAIARCECIKARTTLRVLYGQPKKGTPC